jgi:hypothetical protein
MQVRRPALLARPDSAVFGGTLITATMTLSRGTISLRGKAKPIAVYGLARDSVRFPDASRVQTSRMTALTRPFRRRFLGHPSAHVQGASKAVDLDEVEVAQVAAYHRPAREVGGDFSDGVVESMTSNATCSASRA